MPLRNMEPMTTKDPMDSNAIPEMPLPLVHPSAKRAPSTNKKPPQKAIIARGKNAGVFNIVDHIGEILSGDRLESRLEKKAPKGIPITKASCHQFLRSGKQPVSPPWPRRKQETVPNDPEAPNEACRSKKTGICSKPMSIPAVYGDQAFFFNMYPPSREHNVRNLC
jgi:hypothetical protein